MVPTSRGQIAGISPLSFVRLARVDSIQQLVNQELGCRAVLLGLCNVFDQQVALVTHAVGLLLHLDTVNRVVDPVTGIFRRQCHVVAIGHQ